MSHFGGRTSCTIGVAQDTKLYDFRMDFMAISEDEWLSVRRAILTHYEEGSIDDQRAFDGLLTRANQCSAPYPIIGEHKWTIMIPDSADLVTSQQTDRGYRFYHLFYSVPARTVWVHLGEPFHFDSRVIKGRVSFSAIREVVIAHASILDELVDNDGDDDENDHAIRPILNAINELDRE